jgi:hypothetical protein
MAALTESMFEEATLAWLQSLAYLFLSADEGSSPSPR